MIDSALMSRQLAWDDAQSLQDEVVEFFPDEASPAAVPMRVIKVASRASAGGLRQFSIVFRGPRNPVYSQRTYRFRHARLGDHAIFITPIAQTPEHTDYEACFSHAA